MLIKRFRVKDIREYEDTNNENILEYFNTLSVYNIIKLVSLGNCRCDDVEAADILDKYLESHNFIDAVLEIKEALIGKGDNSKDEDEYDENNSIDLKKYNSLTDLYSLYCMQLMSVGFGYSEFWELSTKDLYRVFNSISIKRQNEINQSLQLAHTQAALIGQAVWGKLQRDVPQVNIVNNENADVDTEDLIMVAKLKAFAESHNRRVRNEQLK